MCIIMYVCVLVCVCIYMCTLVYYTCLCMFMCVCIYMCVLWYTIHVCVCSCVYVYTYIYNNILVCVYIIYVFLSVLPQLWNTKLSSHLLNILTYCSKHLCCLHNTAATFFLSAFNFYNMQYIQLFNSQSIPQLFRVV